MLSVRHIRQISQQLSGLLFGRENVFDITMGVVTRIIGNNLVARIFI